MPLLTGESVEPGDVARQLGDDAIARADNKMREIKPLKKLWCEPYDSEVFYCSLMGIGANRHDMGERVSQVKLIHSVLYLLCSV
jgi:hypothetical protein